MAARQWRIYLNFFKWERLKGLKVFVIYFFEGAPVGRGGGGCGPHQPLWPPNWSVIRNAQKIPGHIYDPCNATQAPPFPLFLPSF